MNYMKTNIVSWILIDPLWRVLLIKRKYNKKDLPNYWAFPGWKVENWEETEDAVIREIKEETWLDFKVQQLYLQEEWEYTIFYRFLWSHTGNLKIQDEECDGYGWFFYNETENLLINTNIRQIIDSLYNKELIR